MTEKVKPKIDGRAKPRLLHDVQNQWIIDAPKGCRVRVTNADLHSNDICFEVIPIDGKRRAN